MVDHEWILLVVLFLNHHALVLEQTAYSVSGMVKALFRRVKAIIVTDCAFSSQVYFQCRVACNKAQVADSCQCKR